MTGLWTRDKLGARKIIDAVRLQVDWRDRGGGGLQGIDEPDGWENGVGGDERHCVVWCWGGLRCVCMYVCARANRSDEAGRIATSGIARNRCLRLG